MVWLALNFNGTCGIWRRAAIDDAGGWQHDTLTEDLDLSYRAHLKGWHASYRTDIDVPGEIPASIDAWRSQQFRWAKGSLQTAVKLLPTIWRSKWGMVKKFAATAHLTHYLVHPAILLSLFCLPFALPWLVGYGVATVVIGGLLLLCGMAPPIILYAASQRILKRPWHRFLALPMLTAVGTGIACSNARAAWEVIRKQSSGFVRTPKSGSDKAKAAASSYRAQGQLGLLEIAAASWGLVGLMIAWGGASPWLAPIVFLYVSGFGHQAFLLMRSRVQEAIERREQATGDPTTPEDLKTTGPAPSFFNSPALFFASAVLVLVPLIIMVMQPGSWRDQPQLFCQHGDDDGGRHAAGQRLCPTDQNNTQQRLGLF